MSLGVCVSSRGEIPSFNEVNEEVILMDTLSIFGLQFALSLVVFGLLAKWYVLPWLAQYSTRQALVPLLIPHALRHLGMAFLVNAIRVKPFPGTSCYHFPFSS